MGNLFTNLAARRTICSTMTKALDELDGRLIAALAEHPRVGVLELARMLGVARGTVQARLGKLVDRGVITGFAPDVDLKGIGYAVLGFTSIEIARVASSTWSTISAT